MSWDLNAPAPGNIQHAKWMAAMGRLVMNARGAVHDEDYYHTPSVGIPATDRTPLSLYPVVADAVLRFINVIPPGINTEAVNA